MTECFCELLIRKQAHTCLNIFVLFTMMRAEIQNMTDGSFPALFLLFPPQFTQMCQALLMSPRDILFSSNASPGVRSLDADPLHNWELLPGEVVSSTRHTSAFTEPQQRARRMQPPQKETSESNTWPKFEYLDTEERRGIKP